MELHTEYGLLSTYLYRAHYVFLCGCQKIWSIGGNIFGLFLLNTNLFNLIVATTTQQTKILNCFLQHGILSVHLPNTQHILLSLMSIAKALNHPISWSHFSQLKDISVLKYLALTFINIYLPVNLECREGGKKM